MFDYLIVGAGFAGSVLAERLATQAHQSVLLIDRRSHVGGNAYDYYDEHGILIHKYGPHIFHTNARMVFEYLSRFTHWRPYEHRVLTSVDGRLLPFPINRNTLNQLYHMQLDSTQFAAFLAHKAIPLPSVRTAKDLIISQVGVELYEKFFQNYTRKQWNRDADELDAAVTARVATRNSEDDRYFLDTYQAMPLHGYTHLFKNMLAHPLITLKLDTDFMAIKDQVSYRQLIYTGPIDEYFAHCFGALPYRSLDFITHTMHASTFQPVAVINYPNEHEYTRVTEFKHLTGQVHSHTTIMYEYPRTQGDPYYPVRSPESTLVAGRYKTLSRNLPNVHFVGRLGTYQYYNMDQVVAQSLSTFEKITSSVLTY